MNIKKLYYDFDKVIRLSLNANPDLKNKISCKKGCAGCCYQKILCTKNEALLIIGYIKKQQLKFDKKFLNKQVSIDDVDTHDWWYLPKEKRKCIFLDENNLCLIYKVRPIVCRTHFVISDSKLCHEAKTKMVSCINFEDLTVKAVLMLCSNTPGERINSLAYWLSRLL